MDVLRDPLKMDDCRVNTLCIENKQLFRKILLYLLYGIGDDLNLIISDNHSPYNLKKDTEVIQEYLNLNASTTLIKKIYDNLADYCNNELYDDLYEYKKSLYNLF